jgi:hypothetical protein
MPDADIVASFSELLQGFSSCFTRPSFTSFVVLACGWVLDLRRRTVTEVVRAAQALEIKHISSFHRFFSRGRWNTDAVGLVLIQLIDCYLLKPGAVVVAPVDDTLGRHTGKKIAAASMHRDPLLSTGRRPFFHWGHVWVVLSINVYAFGKTWALPALVRLYRSKKRCAAEKKAYRKTTELAAELVGLLSRALPQRQIRVVGDAAYTNRALIRNRPSNVTMIGRSRPDAALYAKPPVRRRGKGRPRVKGKRLASPGARAAKKNAPWQRVEVTVYGETVSVRVLVIDALWYVAARGELLRMIVVRGFPGHKRDDVFVSTDATLGAKTIVECFSERWALEVTFNSSKGRLGLEDPQNRTERAVLRTAPMALWLYSLVVLWYVKAGQHLRVAELPILPWYTRKTTPAFSDMLATLRRAFWLERLSLPCANVQTLRKRIRPILQYAAAA